MTPREPDRYEAKAKELCLTEWRTIAAALRAEHDDALERAAQWHIERAVSVERALPSVRAAGWFSEADFKYFALRMTADREDAESIRALASPAAAPAADPATEYDKHVVARSASAPPSEPAPLLPRVLALMELAYSRDLSTVRSRLPEHGIYGEYYALATELRAYIAEREPAEKRIAELEAALLECVGIVDAAGLLNLSNGVQLGQTSWYVKAFDAFDHARKLAARAAKANGDGR